jgi:tetratricopeptide (TPR) repeat protein
MRRRGGLGRGRRLPQLSIYSRRRYRGPTLAWLVIGGALVVLALVVTVPYWAPLLSWIVPDRYVLAYAPEAVQRAVFDIDVQEQVPTAAAVDARAAADLLANLEPTPTPTQAPSSSDSGSNPGAYVQPTPFAVAPTPTLTPVFALDVDARAEDRDNSADLSQADYLLQGFNFTQQGYNNCGPASISTMMSYWGVNFSQAEAAEYLKPTTEDPNVRPDEMAAFIATKGYQIIVRYNGNIELLKEFVLAGYPVLIETGYDPEPDTVGWTSHYLTIAGFSDQDQSLIAMDTYRRPNWSYPYREIDKYWRQFNRRYLVAYRPDQAAAVASIIGEDMDDETMYTGALHTAQFELSLDRNDPYAWFNLGSSLVGLGRYEEAATAFDQARVLGLPWRFLWYQFTPFEAYLQVGRYDDVIELADSVLAKKRTEEPFYYKGLAYSRRGDVDEARRQFTQALHFNENYTAAQMALDALGDS